MRDIAGSLGVSTVTVSKALAGKEGVGEALRKQIEGKAREMGYVYNSLPQSLLLGRTFNIGILIAAKYLGEISFYWLFYQRLLEELRRTKYFGILEIVDAGADAACAVPALITAHKVDGIILLGQFPDTYLQMIAVRAPRSVFLDFYSDIGARDSIASNNFLGAYKLAWLLIEAGHKRIAFIGSTSATTSILDRYLGFCKAMMEAGLPYEPAIEDRDARGFSINFPLEPKRFSAFVCNNDQLAGMVITRLRSLGFRVPEDVSIVGFDNEYEMVTGGVGVTSLEVNVPGMCEAAVDRLIAQIEIDDYRPRGKTFIDGRVVAKQSIAPPKSSY
jgi:LacI family transcriptional regulator